MNRVHSFRVCLGDVPKDMESQMISGLYDDLGNLLLWPAKNTNVVYFMLSLDPGNYG